jgi:SEC-C motif-containing protein|tara:strand:+ start:315 stop:626 length:312 start_codon:yes stop_codon:yes gene_type:complete
MLNGTATAQSAEALMRSRYTAYVLGDMGYVSATWHPSTRPSDLEPDAVSTWLGLDVKSHSESGDTAQVSFVARYRVAGKGHRLQEHSQFVREAGVWFYVDALK